MKQKCKINKVRDLGYTIPDLAIDIAEAVETGVVKKTEVSVSQYNMIQDTDEVGSVITDVFSGIEASRSIDNQITNSSTASQE